MSTTQNLLHQRSSVVVAGMTAIASALLILEWPNSVQADSDSKARHQWEYKVTPLVESTWEKELNEFGRDGWELIAVSGPGGNIAYLRRSK